MKMEGEQIKKRIKRDKPNKKWLEEEVKQILNYLQEAPEIEAPTAQIFYKKFIEISGIDATWELIRWKVRHLKSSFKKANDWRKSTGAGLLESDAGTSTVEGKVLQMCPYYKHLNEIFGEKTSSTVYEVIDSGEVTLMDITTEVAEPCLGLSFSADAAEVQYNAEIGATTSPPRDCSNIQTNENPSSTQVSTAVPKKAKDFAEKMKKHAPKSSVAHLAAFQVERTEMMKIKMQWEKEKHEKDLAFNDRKLKLEEEKVKAEIERGKAEIENKKLELDLKFMELEKDERLKILQIEKDERLQKFEIEMKYKCHSQK